MIIGLLWGTCLWGGSRRDVLAELYPCAGVLDAYSIDPWKPQKSDSEMALPLEELFETWIVPRPVENVRLIPPRRGDLTLKRGGFSGDAFFKIVREQILAFESELRAQAINNYLRLLREGGLQEDEASVVAQRTLSEGSRPPGYLQVAKSLSTNGKEKDARYARRQFENAKKKTNSNLNETKAAILFGPRVESQRNYFLDNGRWDKLDPSLAGRLQEKGFDTLRKITQQTPEDLKAKGFNESDITAIADFLVRQYAFFLKHPDFEQPVTKLEALTPAQIETLSSLQLYTTAQLFFAYGWANREFQSHIPSKDWEALAKNIQDLRQSRMQRQHGFFD